VSENDLNGSKTQISVPLEKWVEEIADRSGRVAAQEVIAIHKATCEAAQMVPVVKETAKRVENLRLRYVALVAFMVGSGLLGGGISFVLGRIVGG